MHLRGFANLAGWQWLFIVCDANQIPLNSCPRTDAQQLEGVWTVILGIGFVCLFPGTPSRPVTLIGLRYFNDREVLILQQRILREDSHKHALTKRIEMKVVYKAVCLPRQLRHDHG